MVGLGLHMGLVFADGGSGVDNVDQWGDDVFDYEAYAKNCAATLPGPSLRSNLRVRYSTSCLRFKKKDK